MKKKKILHITHLGGMSRSQGGFNKGCKEIIQISDSILGGMEGNSPQSTMGWVVDNNKQI